MEISYKNSWDEIQQALIDADKIPKWRQKARDAFELKSAIESIDQQKRIADYQEDVIRQQEEVNKHSKILRNSTIILTIFTALLFFSTACYTYINYRNLVEARDQLLALKAQSDSIDKLERSITSIEKIVSNKLIKSLDNIAGAAASASR